ncbi:MAG: hypothetical protein ACODAE_08165 [Gemmatimonadota bacterium]
MGGIAAQTASPAVADVAHRKPRGEPGARAGNGFESFLILVAFLGGYLLLLLA